LRLTRLLQVSRVIQGLGNDLPRRKNIPSYRSDKGDLSDVYRWAGRAGPATGHAEADADDRHLADTVLGEAGHKSPVREGCAANVIHFRPPAT